MIKSVFVDGYRSLRDFRLSVNPGVNIFIGPNGGGKTNILSLFELISSLAQERVEDAISTHGGVPKVFTLHGEGDYERTISCTVSGDFAFSLHTGRTKILQYRWEVVIEVNPSFDDVSFKSQTLALSLGAKPSSGQAYDLRIRFEDLEETPFWIDKCVVSRLQPVFRPNWRFSTTSFARRDMVESTLLDALSRFDLRKYPILESVGALSPVLRRIQRDITGSEVFNIVPEVCKRPEDASRKSGIEKNGAGLSSMLYRLAQSVNMAPRDLRMMEMREARISGLRISPARAYRSVQSYMRLINPAVTGIKANRSHVDNNVTVTVTVTSSKGEVDFPLSMTSDGTVKWLALVTKLLVSPSGFLIEEPENFLHPNAQKEFVMLCRLETDTPRAAQRYSLVTTHSESLLNAASPEELVVVWMENGRTVAKRVTDVDKLKEEINRTGFGLGYYYVSGTFDDA